MGCYESTITKNVNEQEDITEESLIGKSGCTLYNMGLVELRNQRYKNAYTCFNTGMRQRDLACKYELGWMYKRGEYVEKDEVKADELIKEVLRDF